MQKEHEKAKEGARERLGAKGGGERESETRATGERRTECGEREKNSERKQDADRIREYAVRKEETTARGFRERETEG